MGQDVCSSESSLRPSDVLHVHVQPSGGCSYDGYYLDECPPGQVCNINSPYDVEGYLSVQVKVLFALLLCFMVMCSMVETTWRIPCSSDSDCPPGPPGANWCRLWDGYCYISSTKTTLPPKLRDAQMSFQ